MTTRPGTIIVLNGASSSGKTSIVKALQATLHQPYLEAGIDKFLWMLPGRYLDVPLWQEVLKYTWSPPDSSGSRELTIEPGQLGNRLMSGMHQSIAALSRAGNNVVADHVLLATQWVEECANAFDGLPAWLIGVRCPLDILEGREKSRRDRTIGQARAQYVQAHACVSNFYDLELDTSMLTPEEGASRISALLDSNTKPHAFSRLLKSRGHNVNQS